MKDRYKKLQQGLYNEPKSQNTIPVYDSYNPDLEIPGFEIDDYRGKVKDATIYPQRGLSPLQEERAQNQSTLDKWANATGKMAITAGTTFLDGTVGTLAGLVNMGIEGEGSAFWNNGVSKWLAGIQDIAEEDWLPNYYSRIEQERPWYENMLTANFWADKVLKNMGFMIGTVASSMLYGGATRGLLGAKDVAKNVGKGLMGKTLKNGSLVTNADDGLMAYLKGEVSGIQIMDDIAKDARALRNIDGASQIIGSVAGSVGEARIEALQGVKEYAEKRRLENPNLSEEQLQKEISSIGNSIFLTNMAVLSLGNYAQFRSAIGGGYTANKLDFNNLIKGGYADKFTSAIPENKLGKIAFQAGQTVKAIKNPLWEGMEEQLQKVGQEASTAFYGKGKDDKTEEAFAGYLDAFADKLGEQFGSIDNWEEFAIGFISGGLGAPTIKNSKPIIAGGLWGEIQEQRAKTRQVNDVVEAANKSAERLKSTKDHALRAMAISADKQQSLEDGDKFGWLNADNAEIVNDITLATQLGRLEEFKAELKAKQNISSEEIKAFFDKQTGDNRFKNKSEEDVKKEVADYINKVANKADKIQKTVDDLRVKFPKLSDEVVNEIAYYVATEDDLNSRSEGITNKLSELSKLLDGRNAKEVAELSEELGIRKEIVDELRSRRSKIKNILGRNKGVTEELGEFQELETELTSIKENNKANQEIGNAVDDLVSEIKEINQYKANASTLLEQLKTLPQNKRREQIEVTISKLKQQEQDIRSEIKSLEDKLSNVQDEAQKKELKEEIKFAKDNVKSLSSVYNRLGRLKTESYKVTKEIVNTNKEINELNENDRGNREKIIETLAPKTGLTFEEYGEKLDQLIDKNEKLGKELKDLYNYKPNLRNDANVLLRDLGKVEKRKRDFIARIAAAYSSNGVEDIQDAINKFEDNKKEKKNKELFDREFTNGKIVLDTEEGKEYKIIELNGNRYLYDKDSETGEWTNQIRKLEYSKGILNKYNIVDPTIQRETPKEKVEVESNEEIKDVRYDNEEVIDKRETKDYEFDSNPKRLLGTRGTVGNIGEVVDGEIIIKGDEDVIRFQNYIDTHKVEDFKGRPVRGNVIFGNKWEAKKKELQKLGYANPDEHLWVILIDNDGKEIKEDGKLVFTSLAVSAIFTPLTGDNEARTKASLTDKDFNPNEMILIRDKNGNYTTEEWDKRVGNNFGIKIKLPEFNENAEVIKYTFAINRKFDNSKAENEYEAHKKLLENPPDEIKFSHKTRGIALLQDKEYDIAEYLTDNKLSKDEVDLIVSTDGTIQAFGTSYNTRKGFTYLIDKKNGRIIQVKPRKLTAEEKTLVIDLFKLYTSKATIKKDGKIDTTSANNLERENSSLLDEGITAVLNRLIGFNKGTNNTSDKATEEDIKNLNNAIRSLSRKPKTKKNINEYNNKIEKLEKAYASLSTHSRSIYFQSNFHDRETPPGGFIVIGFKKGKPNAVPLFKQVNGKAINEISDEALTELEDFLKDKWYNVKNRDLENLSEDGITIPTEIKNGKVTKTISYKGKDGYKRMLLGGKPDSGEAPTPILQTRQAKEIKGTIEGREYEGKLPTAANRYLVMQNNQQKVDKPTPKKTTRTEQSKKAEFDGGLQKGKLTGLGKLKGKMGNRALGTQIDAKQPTNDELQAIMKEQEEMQKNNKPKVETKTTVKEAPTKSIISFTEELLGTKEESTDEKLVRYMSNSDALFNENKKYIADQGFETIEEFMEEWNSMNEEDKKSYIDDVINNC